MLGYFIMFMSVFFALLSNIGLLFEGTIGNIIISISSIFTFLISIYVFSGKWEKKLYKEFSPKDWADKTGFPK